MTRNMSSTSSDGRMVYSPRTATDCKGIEIASPASGLMTITSSFKCRPIDYYYSSALVWYRLKRSLSGIYKQEMTRHVGHRGRHFRGVGRAGVVYPATK